MNGGYLVNCYLSDLEYVFVSTAIFTLKLPFQAVFCSLFDN